MIRTARGLSTIGGVCAAALIAASVGVVCQMVWIRYVLGMTTIWQTDFVTFALVASAVSLLFALVLAWLATAFWHEAWTNNWRSDSMWRARPWIPYAEMPAGLIVLSIQMLADLAELLTGRQHPFGIAPGSSVAQAIAVREIGT